tara:strand:+ start:1975 stop:2700 length:726 start_codon:yes stop_codon:yes gene_type:complete
VIGKWLGKLAGAKREAKFSDVEPWQREIVRKARPYSMTSVERLLATINAVNYIIKADIPGAIVECGVWRGGQMMAAALALKALGAERELVLFDTFQGMTEPGERDKDIAGAEAVEIFHAHAHRRRGKGWCEASLEDVRSNIASTGYTTDRVHYVKGAVEETIPRHAPAAIALLRLDTDWYASTRHEFIHLYPKVSRRGVVAVDDYGHWQGARQATDEYLAEHGITVLLERVDYTCRQFIKP